MGAGGGVATATSEPPFRARTSQTLAPITATERRLNVGHLSPWGWLMLRSVYIMTRRERTDGEQWGGDRCAT